MHPGHRACCPQVSPLLQVLKEDGDGLPSTLPTTVAPRMPSVSIAPFPGPFQSHRAQGHPPPPVSVGLYRPRCPTQGAVVPHGVRDNGTYPGSPDPPCAATCCPCSSVWWP